MTNEKIPERPDFDYANMPYLPREGVQGGPDNKGRFLTKSLFLETAEEKAKPSAMWCLSEHEVYAYGRWYPSAWMVYINATDEYDALRKICGNVRQWERIKSMRAPKDMTKVLEDWKAEQAYMQRSEVRRQLTEGALSGGPGYVAAAKELLKMIDGPRPLGRPKGTKNKPKDDVHVDVQPQDDLERVMQQMG